MQTFAKRKHYFYFSQLSVFHFISLKHEKMEDFISGMEITMHHFYQYVCILGIHMSIY